MKRKEKVQECYGTYSASCENCLKCIYSRSCELYTRTAPGMSSRMRLISFDNSVYQWFPAPETDTPGYEDPAEPRSEMISALAQMLKWIMSLDSYTLGIVAEMIAPSNAAQGDTKVSYLAEIRGCSRQAIHEKMLLSVKKFPELASLFQTALRRVGNMKSKFECCAQKKKIHRKES